MKQIIICFIVLLSACSTNTFFGNKVVGPYVNLYNNKLECAFVQYDKSKVCKCHIINDSIVEDKTFLTAPDDAFCELDFAIGFKEPKE